MGLALHNLFIVLVALSASCTSSRITFDGLLCQPGAPAWELERRIDGAQTANKTAFIDKLIANMTVPDLVLQLHLMFGANLVGPNSDNSLYDYTMRFSPTSPVGVIHDWYPLNKSHHDNLQKLNLQKARLPIPFMHFGECLHGVGSFKQSMFPQSIGMSATFDVDIVHRVGRAIGSEARSIGIHACFSPVLDLGQDPRWGRAQEAWGEDKVLTSLMGVAYASGLSKNGSWSDPDAVVPVVKHFAAHGSPQSGRNAAPFLGRGVRQVLQDMLTPFKAVVDLGGARGVMMAYNELDEVPAVVHPLLYKALEDWGFDGFTLADDTAIKQLEITHKVATSAADAIGQWFNAGGMVQFYDYTLETFLNATEGLVANKTVSWKTLQSHVRKILSVKWDLGLFNHQLIPEDIDPMALVSKHKDLTLEAAQKSIVLLENKNTTLPLRPSEQNIAKIAVVGPFADMLNYGDYSGTWGQYPVMNANTIRQGMLEHLKKHPEVELLSSWGANSWEYNAQNTISSYLLSANGAVGGLQATYFANTDFTDARVRRVESPTMDWGIYPPPGLPSCNFSAIWEGELHSPVDMDVEGWIGVAVGPNTTVKLFVDGVMAAATNYSRRGNILGNIMPLSFSQANGTLPPPGSAPLTFRKGATYRIRIEYQALVTYQRIENQSSLNSQVLFFWNLVNRNGEAISQAVSIAKQADIIVLAVGASWNSDGENGDRTTLGLAPSQDALARAMYGLEKPVVLVLQGGRPWAIPEHYEKSAAVLNTFFPGQSGGQAIADVLFGSFNPGAGMPITVPRHVGQVPAYYNYKPSARIPRYVDADSTPCYPFGYGLSYTTFEATSFRASSGTAGSVFAGGDTITFSALLKNNGKRAGSRVLQVYLLGRVSAITQPVKQLVAFRRIYLEAGQEEVASLTLEVDRYLKILNREYEWELEKGDYTFALLEHGGAEANTSMNATMRCV